MNLFYREPKFFENTIYSKIFDASQKYFVTPNSTPVFVVGNQKSGTTVIARLFSMALGQSILSDIPVRNGILLQRVIDGKQPFEIFYRTRPHFFSQDIIKEPALTFFIGDLLTLCPKATFIFIVRDPRDNIKSILNRVDIPGNLKRINLYNAKDLNIVWENILAGHGDVKNCSYINNLSYRWNACIEQFIAFSRHLNLLSVGTEHLRGPQYY